MTLTERLLGELAQEAGNTKRTLERVPEGKLSWKPHEKSMSLGQLALHVASMPRGIAELVSVPVRELPTVPRPEAKSVAEILSALEGSMALVKEKLQGWGDKGLDEPFRLTRQGKTVMELTRYQMLRAVMLNHWYHHRGQLMVYFRLLGVPVPAIYGDSADEKPM